MKQAEERVRRRWWRRLRLPLLVLLCYLVPVGVGLMNPSVPFDVAVNLIGTTHDEALEDNPDQPTVVVLQHGLWRSSFSLWRLERALRDHGYEVLNVSYPGTQESIEQHGRRLGKRLDEFLRKRARARPRLCFIGHSMGGLVIRSYLAQAGARKADLCLFIGTPHRGASLVDKRKEGILFRIFMGTKASLQLSPGNEFFSTLPQLACPEIGVILGARGDGEGWNEDIPGDDDGTVGKSEAQLPEQTDLCILPIGHTRLSCAAMMIEEALNFLTKGSFRDS